MGVYEDLLKRKKIIEDQQGNVTVNAVVNKNTRDKLTDNSIQTYQQDMANNRNAIQSMNNIMQRTAKNTIWEQMQNLMFNKPITSRTLTSNVQKNFNTEFNKEIKGENKNKNKNLLEDTLGLSKMFGLGASTGVKQVSNYIENANENNFANYKNIRKNQFMVSPNVSKEEKIIAKAQDNSKLLLNKQKKLVPINEQIINKNINLPDRVETNLVKKSIQDSISKDEEKIQEEQSKLSNPVTQKLGEIAPSMGQMAVGTVASAINPVLGTTYFTTSAGGSYIDDAKKRGMSDKEAFTYGTIMGALEGASESVITGQQLSKVSKAFTGKQISKKILESYGFNIFENAVQEAVMEPAQEITAGMVGNKADWTDMGKRMAQSGFNGALMGAISNGVTAGLSKSGQIYNKIQNGETITETEYREALQENIDKFGKDVVKESMKNGATEVYQEINNLQSQSIHNQQNNQTQQIAQQENKTAQNGYMEQILPTQNYYYEKSDNTKIDNLRKDANKYFNNSEKARNYVNMLEKIITDKDIDIRLDTNLKTPDGKIANGSYSNGVITINPNSNRAGEFIAIHELTHAIGTGQMKNIVQKYRESNTEFDTAVNTLLQNYNTTELTEEAMADVAGQLFGNQEFINNLAQTEPSLFRKIYNEIKYLWHQFTGYKNQDQFINDLQYKWEQAYRNNAKLNETTNYSIAGRKSLENIRNNKILYNSGINSYNQAQQMASRNISNEQIRQKTGWFQDKNGDWKYEFSDKNLNVRNNITLKKNGEYSLNQIIEHDTLFKLYPELKNIDIKFKDTKGIGGNYKGESIILSNDLLGNNKKIEKTLVHEIQHAIQEIEGFETGTTSKLSKKVYYENLGEIEADNVSKRFLDEKYNNIDISNMTPESSKLNPKHRNYDKYMKNRNSIDKIKDSMFKYAKKGGNSNDINQEYVEQANGESIQDSNKEIWNRLKSSKKSSFSMEDNQGRTLSKEQHEYFKDSKVRDENGNLLTMYHGTPNGDYTVFKDGTYFSPRKEYADGYQNTWASAISTKQNSNNPKTYEVYLNITNPFTLQNPKAKNIYLNEFIKGGNSLSYDPYTDWTNDINNLDEIDWTEAEDLREWLLENHPEYDGLILDEGGDGGYGEAEYRWRGKSFVPFNANQIKNVDNTNPTDNSDIRYSQNNETWQSYLDKNYKPTGTRTNLKEVRLPTKNDVKTKTKLPINANTKKVKFDSDNLIQESNKMSDEETAQILTEIKGKTNEKRKMSAFLKANLIDKGMIFEELSRKTNNRELQGKYDYTLTAEARGQNAIGNARYDYQTITKNGKIKKGEKNAKRISKSLTEIIDEVGENPADFYNYMYHQLNIDRMTLEERFGGDTGINYERKNTIKNKPVFGKGITAEISQKYVQKLEQKHPEFKGYAQDVYDFLDANTKELVDNGVISKETQQLFKEMYPHYVPISRVTNKGQAINVPLDTGRTGVNSPIKRAKGGNGDINPLFQTIADRTLQTYRASARNNFGIELKNTLDKAKQLNQITELTDIDSIMESMTDEEQNNNLLQKGVNGRNPTFTVFENGEKVTYEISKDMYDALKPKNELLKRIDSSMLSKGLNKANNFRRGLLTEYNPVFSITNAIKDAQDVLLNSQHSAKTYSKIPEATAQILSKGYWYKEYIQNGGEQNSYFRDGEFDATKNTLPTRAKKVITFPLKAISNVNNVIEMTPRLAEYIVSRQQGRSIETSMLDASRVTTNFKAGGDITKTLNRNGFTFLNASVQGMQQQIRNIQEANAKGLKGYAVLATKYAIAGLPALILNNLIWDDDDEYKDLQDYVKDNYYIIGKSEDGTFIRIPKGRAVATIQKIVSNADEFIEEAKSTSILNIDKLGSRFWNDLKEDISFAKDNLAPNNPMDNNILAPIIQAITNKTWYGEELIPSRLQDKPSNEQYDESTDKFSRWLGEKTGISPIKINYLIDQYSGGVGDVLLPIGTPQAENNVIEDKFTTDPTMKSKYPGDFFSKVDELKVNSNSDKATDEDTLKYKYISDISSDISKLYQKKREIQNSNNSDEDKKKRLKEIQKQINDLAKSSLEKVDKLTKGSNYAQIDANQYYKDVEGKWKAVSEKDIEKNKKSGLSLKTYSSYKYEMSKVKQEKVNKGEMTKEQNLKDNEQIQILLDSSYSDKDKSTIYENYIKSSVKEGKYDSFKVIKASGININEYLKYEQQEFKSDKKDDGTLDGKTVSKSKQKKVESYLNSMNIGGNQRLLLYAMQGYSTTNSQKNQLANYVYELNLDKETKLELYNKFSGFKVYKDGTIKW